MAFQQTGDLVPVLLEVEGEIQQSSTGASIEFAARKIFLIVDT